MGWEGCYRDTKHEDEHWKPKGKSIMASYEKVQPTIEYHDKWVRARWWRVHRYARICIYSADEKIKLGRTTLEYQDHSADAVNENFKRNKVYCSETNVEVIPVFQLRGKKNEFAWEVQREKKNCSQISNPSMEIMLEKKEDAVRNFWSNRLFPIQHC